MITDPAWFYSSLAQASAAIVGLMGGILTARVSDHLALKRRERGELMTEINNVQRHLASRRTHLGSFRDFIRTELERDREAIQDGRATRPGPATIIGWGFSGSGTGGGPVAVAEDRPQREAELLMAEAVLPWYEELSGRITADTLMRRVRQLRDAGGQQVAGDVAPLEHLAPKIQRFSDTVLPRSFPVVVILLAWLAGVGVVWPLAVLPGIPGQPWMGKPAMLLAFAFGLLGLLVYLAVELVGIWRLGIIEAPTREELGL